MTDVNISAQCSKPIWSYGGPTGTGNVCRSCFNTNDHVLTRTLFKLSTQQWSRFWFLLSFFSLGVLTLLAESIPRQEDSQALVSKEDDSSVNYRSDSQNRLKRGTHSGLLNNHWTWSPLICSVVLFLARRTLLFAWLTFFAVALGFHIVPQRENSQAKSYL